MLLNKNSMLKKTIIIILLSVILFPNRATSHSENDLWDFLSYMTKVSYQQTNVFNKRNGIYDFNIGLNISRIPHSLDSVPEKLPLYYGANIELFDLNPGYKLYNDKDLSYYFFDFSLLKLKNLTEFNIIAPHFIIGMDIRLIDKDTKLYSTQDYNWLSAGLELGYEFFSNSNNISVLPEIYFQLGVRSFKIDTVNFKGLDENNQETKWEFLRGGFKLRTAYKYLSLEYDIQAGVMKNTDLIEQSVKLSYSFVRSDWIIGGLFLDYKNNVYQIEQYKNEQKETVSFNNQCLNFGLFIKPFALSGNF